MHAGSPCAWALNRELDLAQKDANLADVVDLERFQRVVDESAYSAYSLTLKVHFRLRGCADAFRDSAVFLGTSSRGCLTFHVLPDATGSFKSCPRIFANTINPPG